MHEDAPVLEQARANLTFIETFLGTLVAPIQTARRLALESRADTSQLPGAFCLVILVFAFDALRLTPAKELGWALINVPGEVTGGLTLWLLSALLVSLAALCFGVAVSKVRAAFVTLGWSLLPWVFLGPIACFWRVFGHAHVILMAVPLCWILFLQIVAIKESFEMKLWQVLVLVLLLPPILSWYQMLQFLQSLTATVGSLLN